MILASQIRVGRALLGVSQRELADTVKRIEAASGIRGAAGTLWKIQTALEEVGVEFIPADESKGPGVRLKDSQDLKDPRTS